MLQHTTRESKFKRYRAKIEKMSSAQFSAQKEALEDDNQDKVIHAGVIIQTIAIVSIILLAIIVAALVMIGAGS
jgi:hypothetical protein